MLGLLLAGIAVALVAVAMLTYAVIKKWFRNNTVVDKDNIRALIQEEMKNGKVKVIQLGFNKKRKEITNLKGYETDKRDQELIDKGPECIIHEDC